MVCSYPPREGGEITFVSRESGGKINLLISYCVFRNTGYTQGVIRSIKDAKTRKVWERKCPKGFPEDMLRTAYRKLTMIHAAESIQDLRSPPGNRLEKLKGNRAGLYSIRIDDQWRICFVWRKNDAYYVEIDDYH